MYMIVPQCSYAIFSVITPEYLTPKVRFFYLIRLTVKVMQISQKPQKSTNLCPEIFKIHFRIAIEMLSSSNIAINLHHHVWKRKGR